MRRIIIGYFFVAVLTVPLSAQATTPSRGIVCVRPVVTPPRVVRRVQPEYTPQAKLSGIEGTVGLHFAVTAEGRPTDIYVDSPMGFGLDESAYAALEKWEFQPATKRGWPLKVQARAEITFRLAEARVDPAAERQRVEFDEAVQTLKRPDASRAAAQRAVQSMMGLSGPGFAPAMLVVGTWMTNAEHVPRNVTEGLALIEKAAAMGNTDALYELALRRIEGRDLPRDPVRGFQEMGKAAERANKQALYYLGNAIQRGDFVPRDSDTAERYFEVCSALGVGQCQYRLGRILYHDADRGSHNYLQAIALFQLAAEQGIAEAKSFAAAEAPNLSADEITQVVKRKQQAMRK
jgi:TonB family protein